MTEATIPTGKLLSIPITAGYPTNKVVMATVRGLAGDTSTNLNTLLGFTSAGVVGFIVISATTGALADQVYALTAGVLTVDPQTQTSEIVVMVWGH